MGSDERELDGRRALVTGSYRGTGAGIARALADEGAHVLVHGFEPGQPDAVVADIGSGPGVFSIPLAAAVPDGLVYAVDVEPAQLDALFQSGREQQVDNADRVGQA